MKNETQDDKVLKHLKRGWTITPIQALEKYGSFRLSAIIHRLRGRGYTITKEMIKNKYNNSFAKYKLVKEEANGK